MKTIKSLVAKILAPDPEVRRPAVAELSRLRSPGARQALVACLDHRDADVRRSAANALGHFEDPSLAPLLVASARLETEPRVQVALWRAASRVFRSSARLEDLGRLAELMTDARFNEDCLPDFCGAILSILAANPEKLPASLVGALTCPAIAEDPFLHTAFETAIAQNTAQRFARPLAAAYLELLQDDAFAPWHAAFIEALGNMRETRAIGTLLEKFQNVPALQDEVLGALSLIGVENLCPSMAAAVRLHEDIYFRSPTDEEFATFFYEGAQKLSEQGGAGVPVLLTLLDHPNGAMRQNARYALEALRQAEPLHVLLRLAEASRDPAKRRLAWEIVSRNHPDGSLKELAAEQLDENA